VTDTHVFSLTVEASGEVTPARTTPEQAGTDEAEPRDDEEPTDG
jgi:hypothetical protein